MSEWTDAVASYMRWLAVRRDINRLFFGDLAHRPHRCHKPRMSTNPNALTLTVAQVAASVGIGSRTIWKLVAAGQFPKPIKLGNATRWRRTDIEDFIAAGSMATFRRNKRGG